jgi:hypothetical protein
VGDVALFFYCFHDAALQTYEMRRIFWNLTVSIAEAGKYSGAGEPLNRGESAYVRQKTSIFEPVS